MKKLDILKVKEIPNEELILINGGIPWAVVVAAGVAIGAGMRWAFEKGEEIGRAMA